MRHRPFASAHIARLVLSALAALALLAVGCGDDGGGGGGGGGNQPSLVRSTCDSYVAAMCSRVFRCVTDAEIRAALVAELGSEAGCRSRAQSTCSGVDASLAARKITFGAAGAAACVDEIETSACGDSVQELARAWEIANFEGCPDVLAGNVAKGGSCADGSVCREENAGCLSPGVCSGARNGESFQIECVATQQGATACPGYTCLSLNANAQGMSGICTATARRSSTAATAAYASPSRPARRASRPATATLTAAAASCASMRSIARGTGAPAWSTPPDSWPGRSPVRAPPACMGPPYARPTARCRG